MLRTACAVLLVAAAAGLARPAAPTTPDPKTLEVPEEVLQRAKQLVRQLGSDNYVERELAEQELLRLGRLARPALLEAVHDDPDAEVRFRCQTLLPRATSLELKARLELFLADADGLYDHNLPGWNEFRSAVGAEWSLFGYPVGTDRALARAARQVFVELIATPANRQLLLAVGGPEDELARLAAARRQELYAQRFPRVVVVNGVVQQPAARRDPTPADVAALLFAESRARQTLAPRNNPITTLVSTSGFVAAATASTDTARVYRALAAAWLESRQDVLDVYYGMSLAPTLGLTEHGLRLAARLLHTPGALPAYRGQAATVLARFGNASHIPLLEKALTDQAVVYTLRKPIAGKPANEWETYEVQVRDVALAVCVLLSGQKVEDYGFVDHYRSNGANPAGYTYTRYYLPEAERPAALEKWKQWRQNNP